MKIKVDVDGDGEDDFSLKVSERYRKWILVAIAVLVSACTGVGLESAL